MSKSELNKEDGRPAILQVKHKHSLEEQGNCSINWTGVRVYRLENPLVIPKDG
jgi:hypothetical protein